MPQAAPPRRTGAPDLRLPGSLAVQVFGVMLILAGVIGTLMVMNDLWAAVGDPRRGMAAWTAGLPQGLTDEVLALSREVQRQTVSTWSFWAHIGLLGVLPLLSVVAGLMLLTRRPLGRKLAVGRALISLCLVLPISGIEGFRQIGALTRHLDDSYHIVGDYLRAEKAGLIPAETGEPPTVKEIENLQIIYSQLEASYPHDSLLYFLQPALSGFALLLFNGLLLFAMTRPSVRTYLGAARKPRVHS